MNKVCLFLITFTCLQFVSYLKADTAIPYPDNIITERIGTKTIQVTNMEAGESPEWFISSKNKLKKLNNLPRTMLRIFTLKASPDKKYLAVLSADEGHPEIDIFDLTAILADKKTESICGIDPYPGVVDIIKWEGEKLHIDSNMFFSEKAELYGRIPESLTLFSIESFLLNIKTGDLKPLSKALKNPVEYYGKHLTDEPDSNSPHTELNAFYQLNDSNAIPFLKKALKMKQYTSNKNEINQLIKSLKNKQ